MIMYKTAVMKQNKWRNCDLKPEHKKSTYRILMDLDTDIAISCELSNLHEMPNFIFSQTIRILYATLMLGALRLKHRKWSFKY